MCEVCPPTSPLARAGGGHSFKHAMVASPTSTLPLPPSHLPLVVQSHHGAVGSVDGQRHNLIRSDICLFQGRPACASRRLWTEKTRCSWPNGHFNDQGSVWDRHCRINPTHTPPILRVLLRPGWLGKSGLIRRGREGNGVSCTAIQARMVWTWFSCLNHIAQLAMSGACLDDRRCRHGSSPCRRRDQAHTEAWVPILQEGATNAVPNIVSTTSLPKLGSSLSTVV